MEELFALLDLSLLSSSVISLLLAGISIILAYTAYSHIVKALRSSSGGTSSGSSEYPSPGEGGLIWSDNSSIDYGRGWSIPSNNSSSGVHGPWGSDIHNMDDERNY